MRLVSSYFVSNTRDTHALAGEIPRSQVYKSIDYSNAHKSHLRSLKGARNFKTS